MVIGITGISGSGKHTVATFFKKGDWVILDADKIGHYLYRPYTYVWKAVVKEFGEKILNEDDTINRDRLGKIVFNCEDPAGADECLKKLNKIMHPAIKRNLKDTIHRHFKRESNILVIAALWEELDLKEYCDKILLVQASSDKAQQRIMKRDSISKETYAQRAKHQSEPPNPDFVLVNNTSIDDLHKQFDALKLEGLKKA